MNCRVGSLPTDKESLVMRSTLCRLRLRRDTHDLRNALGWKRAAVGVATTPAVSRIALGLALSLVGLSRAGRFVMVAGRIVLAVRLARSLIGYARGLTPPRAP